MNEYINQMGMLNEDGKKIFASRFGKEVDALLSLATNENQLRIIGSLLNNMIGNKVADKALLFRNTKNVK